MTVADSAVLFWPRGGSAQVIRYLAHELDSRNWRTRIHAGSLGLADDVSHAASFYDGLDVRAFDYNDAYTAWKNGQNPQRARLPFHPSFEDRGVCPDRMFSAVSPSDTEHLTRAWTQHLRFNRSASPNILHLHHLSHLQRSAMEAYPGIPRVTTLHGTELKHLEEMDRRTRLARTADQTLPTLARILSTDNPERSIEVLRIARNARLDDSDVELLSSTDWSKWVHSSDWAARFRDASHEGGDLVVVSDHDLKLATQLLEPDNEVTIIPNGVDASAFRPMPLTDSQRLQFLRRWLVDDPRGWSANNAPGSIRYSRSDLCRLISVNGELRPLIIWIGRFLEFKRLPVLLASFAIARERIDPAPTLLLWGGYPGECEGVHPEAIVHKYGIEDNVFFAGWRGHDELPKGLNCADLMVAPAVNEPFGMVYLEAMACGTPPIATATGGPARTIVARGDRPTGWLVAADDVSGLANAIVEALTDFPELANRGSNGRAHIEANYSWSRTADEYVSIYENTMLQSTRSRV